MVSIVANTDYTTLG